MRDSQRVLVNTVAQYTRTIINALLSLYTVRVVLSALGQSDYGIYTLIAGVVAALGFVTSSLVSSTQRFMSYYQGKGDVSMMKDVFNNSLVIHIIFGLAIVILLESATWFIFDGFLNIPYDRISAAKIVYQIVVLLLFVSFISSPYSALLVSHENIVYISIVEVLDGVLKVILVVMMSQSSADKLVFYALIMLGIQLFRFFAMSLYDYISYEECCFPKFSRVSKTYVKEMTSFAGWKIYGTASMIGRTQGTTIVLNRFFGTIANAGWGIGAQISAYTDLLSSAIVNAMAPQIVKAEGRGDHEHSLWLSFILSKMVFFLMSVIGIPLMFEIPSILNLWLGNPPDMAAMFSVMFILALLFDSMTIGLTHINNAIGKIGLYTVIMSTPKLFTFLLVWALIKCGFPVVSVCVTYVAIEGICAFVRIPLIKHQVGLSVRIFFKDVILREIIPALFCISACTICTLLFDFKFRFILTFSLSASLYAVSMYLFGLNKQERDIMVQLAQGILKKLKVIN